MLCCYVSNMCQLVQFVWWQLAYHQLLIFIILTCVTNQRPPMRCKAKVSLLHCFPSVSLITHSDNNIAYAVFMYCVFLFSTYDAIYNSCLGFKYFSRQFFRCYFNLLASSSYVCFNKLCFPKPTPCMSQNAIWNSWSLY